MLALAERHSLLPTLLTNECDENMFKAKAVTLHADEC